METESRTLATGVRAGSREKADGGGLYDVSMTGRFDACRAALDYCVGRVIRCYKGGQKID